MKQIEDESDRPDTTIEELVAVPLKTPEPEKTVLIGALLSGLVRDSLVEFLR